MFFFLLHKKNRWCLVQCSFPDKELLKSGIRTRIRIVQGETKKRELLKNPTKIEEIQEQKFIDRN